MPDYRLATAIAAVAVAVAVSSYPRLQQYGDIGYRDIVLSSTLKVILCIVSQSTSKVWRCLQQQCSSFLHKVVVSYFLCGQLDLQVRMV